MNSLHHCDLSRKGLLANSFDHFEGPAKFGVANIVVIHPLQFVLGLQNAMNVRRKKICICQLLLVLAPLLKFSFSLLPSPQPRPGITLPQVADMNEG